MPEEIRSCISCRLSRMERWSLSSWSIGLRFTVYCSACQLRNKSSPTVLRHSVWVMVASRVASS